jgi:hypothetical protein
VGRVNLAQRLAKQVQQGLRRGYAPRTARPLSFLASLLKRLPVHLA